MQEIIKIQKSAGGKDIVSARELYQFLGYEHGQFSRWAKSKIVNNKFGIKNEDWIGFDMVVEGNAVVDYALTLNFAKRVCQSAQTKKGEDVRNYFIECERLSKQPIQQVSVQQLPTDFISALEQLVLSKKSELVLEEKVKELKPKGELFDMAMSSRDTLEMSQVAKILCIKGFGRNNIFERLREVKVLRKSNEPYQDYVDRGWFKIIETPYDKDGETGISIKTVVLQKGMEGIRQILTKSNKQN